MCKKKKYNDFSASVGPVNFEEIFMEISGSSITQIELEL